MMFHSAAVNLELNAQITKYTGYTKLHAQYRKQMVKYILIKMNTLTQSLLRNV